jgi:hypothetical protein
MQYELLPGCGCIWRQPNNWFIMAVILPPLFYDIDANTFNLGHCPVSETYARH